MKRAILAGCTLAIALTAAPVLADDDPEDRTGLTIRIIGRTADVAIIDSDIIIEAKVDTGADSTSIDARNVEIFERDGEEWARFETPVSDSETVRFERPVVETVVIRRPGEGTEDRPVVAMTLCVDDVSLDTEVNLANREGLNYRMLLGRGFLVRGTFLVNVAQENGVKPSCEELLDD